MTNIVSTDENNKVIRAIEQYECYINGKHNLNGGYASADNYTIVEKNNTYIVIADITLGDAFDIEHQHKDKYYNCRYYMDKKTYNLLTDEEIKKRGFTGEEERDDLDELI